MAVRPGLAPHDRSGLEHDRLAVAIHRLAVALHVELLEIGRQVCEVLAVRQDRERLRAEEVPVPDPDEAHEHRAGSPRSGRSGSARPSRGIPRASRVNCSGPIAIIRQRPIAESKEYRPPTQSQNPNMFAGSIPNSVTSASFVDTATKCFAMAASSPSDRERPLARGARVGHRLERREGLRRDDEQGGLGIQVPRRLAEVGAVDVGHEAVLHRPIGERRRARWWPCGARGRCHRCRCSRPPRSGDRYDRSTSRTGRDR